MLGFEPDIVCVNVVEASLARMLAYPDETCRMDKTVIIYTGDQDFMLGEHDYMYNRLMYD